MQIDNLTKEEKSKLLEELQAEEKNKKALIAKQREDYKAMVDMTVKDVFDLLKDASDYLTKIKKQTFDAFHDCLEAKSEVYSIKDGQQSHTFTTADGRISITIGNRVVDRFDDTVNQGVAKVRSYLSSLAKDEDTSRIIDIVNSLLRMDKKGNLRPSRVLELQQLAEKIDDEGFKDGVSIIRDAYRPEFTSMFVEAEHKDENGVRHSLPLSISSIVL